MSFLPAATALIGLLTLVNVLFTLGVVRRLREHTAELAALRSGRTAGSDSDALALPAGSPVAAFAAESVDGRPVTIDALGDRLLVGFLSPHCAPCKERLAGFVEYAATRPAGRDAVLAVVIGTPEEAAGTVAQLRDVATVVVETDGGPVQQAFAVTGFPAFLLVQDGVVEASDFELTTVIERDAAALPAAG